MKLAVTTAAAAARKAVVKTTKVSSVGTLVWWLRRVLNGVVEPMGRTRQFAMLLLQLAMLTFLSSAQPLTAAMKERHFLQAFSREGVCAVTVGSDANRYARRSPQRRSRPRARA